MIRRQSTNRVSRNNWSSTRAGRGNITAVRAKQPRATKKIRYAVVGLGHIAQTAVLPAFKHASKNSELAALISHDKIKLKELSEKYGVEVTGTYKDYDNLLRSGEIDAVFIAEPNSLHRQFTLRAAQAGVHVLCEKPLAVTERECRDMIDACRRNRVKLMTAYRLHFEKSNLEAIKIVNSGRMGEPRYFNSIFSMQVKEGNIRVQKKMGGGPLYDIGIYCINAARYLFQAEPLEALAFTANNGEKRFKEVEEMTGGLLRFPEDKLASFVCSFNGADVAQYEVVGTKGMIQMKNAYEYAMPVEMTVTIEGKSQHRRFEQRDQFGPELIYFSDCILYSKEPEPSGVEGHNDVHIIRALYESARTGRPIKLKPLKKSRWASLKQEIKRPKVREPEKVHSQAPSR